jgi:hypothetical protein
LYCSNNPCRRSCARAASADGGSCGSVCGVQPIRVRCLFRCLVLLLLSIFVRSWMCEWGRRVGGCTRLPHRHDCIRIGPRLPQSDGLLAPSSSTTTSCTTPTTIHLLQDLHYTIFVQA